MDIVVLNDNFDVIGAIDTFESAIWVDRYSACGDVEILASIDMKILSLGKIDYYLCQKKSEHIMVIEDHVITTDPKTGNHVKITGRSLESIIERRIIWGQVILSGNFQEGIKKLITDNIINPTDPSRKIPNFIFQMSTDPLITEQTIDAQFTGDNLYTAITNLCVAKNIGFKITLSETNQLVFQLYSGCDRSYYQFVNPFVVFSPKFDNLYNSNYIESKKTLKTVTLIAGEGEGSSRRTTTTQVSSGSGNGLSRREMFTDARDISSKTDDGTLTNAQYCAQLVQRGSDKLAENTYITSFEGKAEMTNAYTYGKDFYIGDIIQIENEYGMDARSRITEIINSQSVSGIEIYPTFSAII